jgi:hypothetical protein
MERKTAATMMMILVRFFRTQDAPALTGDEGLR